MKEKTTKAEVYRTVIEFQKRAGQGLSGIVKVYDEQTSIFMDELIEEGLVKACDTGSSGGHSESNIFYMPTKGYNVWEDEKVKDDKFKGGCLTHVRLFLGALEDEPNGKRTELYNAIHPSREALLRDVEFMEDYAKWLKRNKKALDVMLNLEEDYFKASGKKRTDIESFSKDEIKWIKGRSWYKENLKCSEALKSSEKGGGDDNRKMEIYEELLSLYNTEPNRYKKEIKEAEEDMAMLSLVRKKGTREKMNELMSKNKTLKVQTLVAKL